MTKSKTAPKASTPSKATLAWPSRIKPEDTAKVADKTGYSNSFVSNVKAGRRYNETIVKAFNGLTARRK